MISLCTVILDGLEPFFEVLVNSIITRTKHISEILVAKVDAEDPNWKTETKRDNIVIKTFAAPVVDKGYGHALGLHAGIARASKEFVMFCEPDLFFYTNVDEFYLDLFNRHELNIIGITHHNACGECSTFFPYPMNLMVKRRALPDENWMKGYLKFGRGLHKLEKGTKETNLQNADGKFLIQGPIPEFQDRFPNQSPGCWFDIGCNLFLWNEDMKGKWISFQTLDTHIYTTKFYKSNFKLKEKFPGQKLVYHQTNCCGGSKQVAYDMLLNAYNESRKHD